MGLFSNRKIKNHEYNLKVLRKRYRRRTIATITQPLIKAHEEQDGIKYSEVSDAIKTFMHRQILDAFYGLNEVTFIGSTTIAFKSGITLFVSSDRTRISLFRFGNHLITSKNRFVDRTYASDDFRFMLIHILETTTSPTITADKVVQTNAKVNFIGAGRKKIGNDP